MMDIGKISKIRQDKHCGMITLSDGREATFNNRCLYKNADFNTLYEGQEVEFYIQRSHKGYLAASIRPLQPASTVKV